MKLSDAIRLGAMLRPQIHGRTIGADGSCALGAALEAIGKAEAGCYSDAFDFFPILSEQRVHPLVPSLLLEPQGPCVLTIVRTLNDKHKWTREQIADWVAALEPADAPVQATVLEPVRA